MLFPLNLLFLSLSPNCYKSFHFEEITPEQNPRALCSLPPHTASILTKLCNFRACLPLAMLPGTQITSRVTPAPRTEISPAKELQLCEKGIPNTKRNTPGFAIFADQDFLQRHTQVYFLWPQ